MTITLSTPMFGPVDIGSEPDVRFLGGAYGADTVRQFWAELRVEAARTSLRASLVAAQIAKETGWFRFGGQVNAAQFNVGGLGATNGGAAGASFNSIEEGVDAVFAHHLVYIFGAVDNWPASLRALKPLDERYDAVLSTGRAGTVKRIGDYTNGNWANSPQFPIGSLANGYATGIVEIANTLSTGDVQPAPQAPNGGVMATEPTTQDIGFPTRTHWAGDIGPKRAISSIQWFIVHDTEGNFAGDENILTAPGNPVESAHALIGKDGQCVFMVPLDKTAWAPGNDAVAKASINVELSGFSSEPYTDEQYHCLAAFFRWCEGQGMNVPRVYIGRRDADGGLLPDVPGIIGHQDVPDGNGGWGGSSHHTDPGPLFEWAKLIAFINEQPAPPHGFRDHVTGKVVANAMYDFYSGNGGVELIGRPLTEEYAGTWPDDPQGAPQRTIQIFEREVLGFFPENPGKDRVQALRLGAKFARDQGFTGIGI